MKKARCSSILLFVSVALLGGSMMGCTKSAFIEDLAYMETQCTCYSDDADPESDGIQVEIMLHDSKSKIMYSWNVPLTLDIEVFAGRDNPNPPFDLIDLRSVYQGHATISKYGEDVRIPFENLTVDPGKDSYYGTAKIVIHTPEQGDFTFNDVPCLRLYVSH